MRCVLSFIQVMSLAGNNSVLSTITIYTLKSCKWSETIHWLLHFNESYYFTRYIGIMCMSLTVSHSKCPISVKMPLQCEVSRNSRDFWITYINQAASRDHPPFRLNSQFLSGSSVLADPRLAETTSLRHQMFIFLHTLLANVSITWTQFVVFL